MGKVWLITGASRGLGKALVEYALSQGDLVVATARDKDTLAFTGKAGADKVLVQTLDVTDYNQALDVVKAAHLTFGRIDILVNNAGYADTASVEDTSIEDFRKQVDTNLMGVVNVTKAVLPIMRQQGSGYIVQISSVGARLGSPGLAAYQCAKWAVSGFSMALHQEVQPLGIKVTALEPGGIRTDWAGSSMKIPPPSEPYQQTVGAFAKFIREHHGGEKSQPEKFGPIIDRLYESPDPPVRMPVGPDAVGMAPQLLDAQKKSDEQWAELGKTSAG
ncbi:uncharacterized protein Z520_03503 [Fonsecaea multimorphosa CBS 102226]|uniref:Ketoreductase domain-containing protein n=1 Tax=Fonsecaea multimorphosa CBS 102226 TaxID=1442371 RepID=A0A0D2IUU8_9EURO|nr:uncharacterized protein Z520_03503 [Fonsecaea multimorphosa CBS 102226]KIY00837.1 hypothetical protein Z520_03503 [Fonsecaea multimorphosa CBS 102226]OAL27936.1 hypothetical protein AYO22_03281 [Fonsecaea multimorphosa]